MISEYGGWRTLKNILLVTANEKGIVLDKGKELLGKWLGRSSDIYSKIDETTRERILNLLDVIRSKGIVSDNALKELNFVIETRR